MKKHQRFPTCTRASLARLHKFIKAHKALLSPVRYLPPEILQEIFLFYADNPSLHFTQNLIAKMPWCLGHISHRWREIALSLPSLWDNNIPKIQIGDVLYADPKYGYARALTYLIQRTGTSPTLKFDIVDPLFWPKPILKEIMLHSERIEQLHISLNDTTIRIFRGFKGCLPNLRLLDIHLTTNNLHRYDLFENAPALRQLRVMGSYPGGSFKVSWSQITHFESRLSNDGPPFFCYLP